MIRDDLLEFQYYLDRLSKFMQESYGINDQVKTFHSLLKQVNDFYDQFFEDIKIFNQYYVGPNRNLLLDKLGSLFGCYRKFVIAKYNPFQPTQIIGYLPIDLNDSDFLTYIKTQIVKQNFNGTREELQTLYSTYVDGQYKEGILNLLFYYIDRIGDASAQCNIYWNPDETPSESLQNLFLNGYLTIESMGITYWRNIVNIDDFESFTEVDSSGNPIDPQSYNYFAYDGYNLLTAKPTDWDEDYTKYYTLQATQNTSNQWIENTYYELIDGNKYSLLFVKPSNWDTAYENFFTIVVTPNSSSTFASNTYYGYVKLGGIFA